MVIVEICVGSACYVKGSNQVVASLKQMIKDHHWEDKVTLKGSFCMGLCNRGLGVRVAGKQLTGLHLGNAVEILEKEISEVVS